MDKWIEPIVLDERGIPIQSKSTEIHAAAPATTVQADRDVGENDKQKGLSSIVRVPGMKMLLVLLCIVTFGSLTRK